MKLDTNLLKEFASLTNDSKSDNEKTESVYGVVNYITEDEDGNKVVNVTLDGGSDGITCGTTVNVEEGDRVLLSMSNNSLVIVGNITNPSLVVRTVIADDITTGVLRSLNGESQISLDDGTFSFGNGAIRWNPEEGLVITGMSGDWLTKDEADVLYDSIGTANAVKDGLATSGYTQINGGNLITGTVVADSIRAASGDIDSITGSEIKMRVDDVWILGKQYTIEYPVFKLQVDHDDGWGVDTPRLVINPYYSMIIDGQIIELPIEIRGNLTVIGNISTYYGGFVSTTNVYSEAYYRNGTNLDDIYAAKSHSHSYLPLSGGTLTGNIRPNANNSLTVGTSSYRWNNIYTNYLNVGNNITLMNDKYIVNADNQYLIGIATSDGVANYVRVGSQELQLRLYAGDSNGYKVVMFTGSTVRPSQSYAGEISLGSSNYRWSDLWLTGDANVSGKVNASNIGTRKNAALAGTVTMPASTSLPITDVALTPGEWILIGHVRYNKPSKAGFLRLNISSTSGSTTYDNSTLTYFGTQAGTAEVVTVLSVSSNTTYYMNATSSVDDLALNTATGSTFLRAIQIS